MISDTVKIENKNNVRMIAHRGLSGLECENTCSAFVAAGNRSYFGIETDIHVTKDGEFAVFHDDSTGRLCDKDIKVESSTYDELFSLILKNTDDTERKDLRIPKLSEYISICKKYGKTAILEIKNPFSKENLEKVIEQIKALDYIDGVVFISFVLDNMITLRELLPDARLQFLFAKMSENVFDVLEQYHFDADVYYELITKEFVDRVHSIGQKVNVWTVNSTDVAKHVIECGVDYITTNILE